MVIETGRRVEDAPTHHGEYHQSPDGNYSSSASRTTQMRADSKATMFAIGELSVPVESVDGEYLAVDEHTGTYGEGDTPEQAFMSLVVSLDQLRSVLRSKSDALAPELRADLDFLDQVLWS